VYSYDGSLLTSVSKGNIQRQYLNYTYDNNFHLTDQESWVPDTSGNDFDKLSEYAYDNDGNIIGISLYDVTPNGLNPGPAMSISYDPNNGRVMGTTLGNVNTSQSYDSNGALSYFETDFGGSSIFQTSYQRDSLNRIRILTEVNQGQMTVKKYAYDIVGRLSQVWRNDTLVSSYSYDANGNRIARWTPSKTDSGSYDVQDRMLSYGSAQYIYSKNGELQKKIVGADTTSYMYDYFGNLMSVRLPNGNLVEYIIDGQNRRIGKKLNGAIVKKWIYAGRLSPVAELDSAGNVTAEFVGSLMMKNGNTYQLVTDHLGSVRLVVDINSGAIVQQLDYDEYGNVLSNSNPDFQPFAYAGGLYDSQTKLVRFGARDYDASVGRWNRKEPVGFIASNNFYAYSDNNPINLIDKNGLWPTKGWLPVHQRAIARVLDENLSPEDIRILQDQQVTIDEDESLEGSYKHAMKAPGQPEWYARLLAENFVRNEIKAAQDCESAGGNSNHVKAMQHLGNAIHTMQDATSPSHKGFQTWYGASLWEWPSALDHVLGELYDPGPGSDLDIATRTAWAYYSGIIPIPGRIF
jgi:RHS repeat-associated protein